MIAIKFGRWERYKARWFIYKRIYRKGWKWTPFVKVRFLGWGDTQNRKEYIVTETYL